MSSIKKTLIAVSVLVMASGFTFSIKAFGMGDSSWPTQVTFVEPLRVGDLSLPAGIYDFYAATGPGVRTVIMIYSVDMRRWEGMVMGVNASQLDTRKETGFTFKEDQNGSHKKLEYWFHPGWDRGIKIVYPEDKNHAKTAALLSNMK